MTKLGTRKVQDDHAEKRWNERSQVKTQNCKRPYNVAGCAISLPTSNEEYLITGLLRTTSMNIHRKKEDPISVEEGGSEAVMEPPPWCRHCLKC